MEIEQSSLSREIAAIINSGVKPVHSLWKAQIHVNGETYIPLKVIAIDFLSDYESSYADEIIITLAISGGTYAKRMYPFKEKIDITLIRSPLSEVGNDANAEQAIETERYTATLLDKGNPIIEGNSGNSLSEDALNLTNIFEISFQLVNKSLEQLRMISVGGVYRNALVGDVIKLILTNDSKKIDVEGIRLVKGVDMVPVSNVTPRDHIVIPQGTKLVHIPEYIHKKCGGVYSAGLGYYLQGDYWYVYPCYDVNRFNDPSKTMTIINVPPNKLSNIERTYRKDGRNLIILATGEVRFRDDSESQQLNAGNGVRFADANKLMNNFSETKNNKTIASRGKNNNEFISTQRETGNNNITLSSNPINANILVETSKLARRQGSVMAFVWENSLPSLFFPGMTVKLMYLEAGEIKEVYGVLLKAHSYVEMHSEGMLSGRHSTRSVISIFINRVISFTKPSPNSFVNSSGNAVAIPKTTVAANINPLTGFTMPSISLPSTLSNTISSLSSSIKQAVTVVNDISSSVKQAKAAATAITNTLEKTYKANGWGKPGS